MGNFTEAFGIDSVTRSKSFTDPASSGSEYPSGSSYKTPGIPPVTSVVVGVCRATHPDTAKPWLVQEVCYWDEACCDWKTKHEGITELPSKLQVGDTLPNFNGVMEIYVGDMTVEVIGGSELPEGMRGFFLCIDGELCYVANPPAQVIPDEVQVGGAQPMADSQVEVWVTDDGIKTQNEEGLWVAKSSYKVEGE